MTVQMLDHVVRQQTGTGVPGGLSYSSAGANTGATERIRTYGQPWNAYQQNLDLQSRPQFLTIICDSLGESALASEHCVLGGESLIDGWIKTFFGVTKGTTLPQAVWVQYEDQNISPDFQIHAKSHSHTTARGLLNDIQAVSRLTLEEVAPLIGVSRRALQNWRAGEPISARKEQRLRDMRDFLASVRMSDAEKVRFSLLNRRESGVRAYDVLAERQFGLAYEMITGKRAPADVNLRTTLPNIPETTPLVARLSVREGGVAGSGGKINIRRSGRLKR